jgi:hypothetical protein
MNEVAMKHQKLYTGLSLFTLTLVIWGAYCVLNPNQAPRLVSRTDPPRLMMEESRHDLGRIQAEPVPYTFKIKNMGGEPLVIQDIKTTCACLSTNLKSRMIEPGKTSDLEIVLDASHLKGSIHESIAILSNDPQQPQAALQVTGTMAATKAT